MQQIWIVTLREYLVQVKKKSFILLTLAMPLLFVAFFALIVFLTKANEEVNHIAVVDNSQLFSTTFTSTPQEIYSFYKAKDLETLKDSLNQSNSIQAILIIPKVDSSFTALKNGVQLISNKNIGVGNITQLQNKISQQVELFILEQKGIAKQAILDAKIPISIKVQKYNEQGISATDETTETVKMFFSSILMYATFMFIMIYGVRVMRSVLEEKNNRVIEIIISSIKPFNLMLGKILGTTLVAITQLAIWVAFIVVILFAFPFIFSSADSIDLSRQAVSMQGNIAEMQNIIDALFQLNYPLIIVSFFIYFFLGYLLYSAFFAAIGASVDSETETQQFMWVGLAPLMVGMYGSFSIMNNPDGPVGLWLSLIPFTSPVAMMTRIAYDVPWWQLVLSIAILLVSVLAMVWFAAKIYRIGILMYGKKPSFKDWYKWLKM